MSAPENDISSLQQEKLTAEQRDAARTLREKAEIEEVYPDMCGGKILDMRRVYYPVAKLKMRVSERSFDDFNAVQLTVLRFFSLNFSDEVIAKTMGLSVNYIKKVKRLLVAWGQIDAGGVTETGIESLKEGRKICEVNTWQEFLADGVTGRILLPDRKLDKYGLIQKRNIAARVPILGTVEYVDEEVLVAQIRGDGINSFIEKHSDAFHVNAVSIDDVYCEEILFADSFLVSLDGTEEPVVFSMFVRPRGKGSKKGRLSEWHPLSAPGGQIRADYGIGDEVPVTEDVVSKEILDVYLKILEEESE